MPTLGDTNTIQKLSPRWRSMKARTPALSLACGSRTVRTTRAAFSTVSAGTVAIAQGRCAAVFGVNDGLVSNTSLVMGVAGSGASGSTARQLFVGVGAAVLVFMIGHLVGVRAGV